MVTFSQGDGSYLDRVTIVKINDDLWELLIEPGGLIDVSPENLGESSE